jgi:4'-phosphopantetheinyl transferase
MPVYKKWQHPNNTHIVIWKIEESEDFFMEQTGLQSEKKSDIRRLEHLAGRFLLQHTLPGFPLRDIAISPLGKPYLPGHPLFFSISHSYPFAAVAINTTREVGIDIQTLQQKILRVQHKFLSATEQAFCENNPEKITLAWSAKEAVFKKYGLGSVDFIRHMPITGMQIQNREAELTMEFSRELPAETMHLYGSLEDDFAWSVTL